MSFPLCLNFPMRNTSRYMHSTVDQIKTFSSNYYGLIIIFFFSLSITLTNTTTCWVPNVTGRLLWIYWYHTLLSPKKTKQETLAIYTLSLANLMRWSFNVSHIKCQILMGANFMSFISVYLNDDVLFQCLERKDNKCINKPYFCVHPHTQPTKIACKHVASTVTHVYGETKGGRRINGSQSSSW